MSIVKDATRVDPITLEVIRSGLISVAREMGLTLLRTSYSPILNEGKDFSTAIFDREGQMVAQMEGCPIHMASMGYAVKAVLERFSTEQMAPGDVFILNDPYRGGMQHNDITLIAPVCADGAPLIFLGVRAHHADIGGKAVGGFPADATEQFQEALIIPPMKYVDAGVLREDLLELILSNVRLRDLSIGDFQASEAAIAVGRRGVERLIGRYGPQVMDEAMQETLRYSEELVRAGISKLPDGVYEADDFMDNDGITDDPFPLKIKITVQGDEMIVDFEGSSPQVIGPLNVTYELTCSVVGVGLLMTCDPNIPVNDGCLRPLTIKAPEGSVLNCRHPAATCIGSIETTTHVIDLVVAALAPAVPERVCAGETGSCHASLISGTFPARDGRFLMVLIPPGGWGGTSEHDGWTSTDEPVGNAMNQPIEYYEMKYPVIIEEYALDPDTAGPGRNRGGHGHYQRILCLTDLTLSTMGSRSKNPPPGLFGGGPGATSAFMIATDDEVRRLPSKNRDLRLPAGSRFTTNPGSGGGYEGPHEREIEAVAQDVRDGFCTEDVARRVYGVAISPDGSVDRDKTESLRKSLQPQAPPKDGGTREDGWVARVGGRKTLSVEAEKKALEPWCDGRL